MTRSKALLGLGALFVLAQEVSSQGYGPTPQEETKLVRVLGLAPGKVVGEIGAGDGQLTLHSAKAVSPGGRVYATELAAKLDTLRHNASAAGVTNVAVVEAQVASTGLPEGCCDAIFMRDVYHHLTAPKEILADILRALRPQGRLLIIDFEPRRSLPPVEGVPENRRGHGIPIGVVAEELKAAGFEIVSQDNAWREDLYAVVARRPGVPPRS